MTVQCVWVIYKLYVAKQSWFIQITQGASCCAPGHMLEGLMCCIMWACSVCTVICWCGSQLTCWAGYLSSQSACPSSCLPSVMVPGCLWCLLAPSTSPAPPVGSALWFPRGGFYEFIFILCLSPCSYCCGVWAEQGGMQAEPDAKYNVICTPTFILINWSKILSWVICLNYIHLVCRSTAPAVSWWTARW